MGIVVKLAACAAFVVGSSFLPLVSWAQTAPVSEHAQESDLDQQLEAYLDHMSAGRFKEALKAAQRLDLADNSEARALKLAFRASALLGLKRDKEAEGLISEMEREQSTIPLPLRTLFFAALISQRTDIAGAALDKLIARFPDEVREFDPQSVWYILGEQRKADKARNEDRIVALAKIGYGGNDGDSLTADAVNILVKRGDISGANELVGYIDAPRDVENLLILKRFASLWPRLESSVGANLANVRTTSVAQAQQDLADAPNDPEKLQRLANALRYARRYEEAIALRERLPKTSSAMASVNEQTGWFANNVALALFEVGRTDDADSLFALLNEAPMKDASWRVSMIINRLELLVGSGRFDRAVLLLPVTEASAKTDGNDYARQLVRRLKYCTLSRLGRAGEAAQILPDLLAHSKDAPGRTIEGLLCAGDLDSAEKVALAALSDEGFHEDFVRSLQMAPLTSDDPSVWSGGWKQLRTRPVISTEFARLGRDLPVQFLPPEFASRDSVPEKKPN